MASKQQYKSLAEIRNPKIIEENAQNEFSEEIPVDEILSNDSAFNEVSTNRRDFLKLLGFSTAAVTLAACEAPVVKSVPYLTKPGRIIPGVPNYYASTYFDGYDLAHVLVKTREGRPIKIENNPEAKYFGTTNARGQASVLSLYDNNRIKEPQLNGEDASWEDVDAYVAKALKETKATGKKIVVLTPSNPSPTSQKLIQEFNQKHGATQVVYDNVSYSPALDAAQEAFGKRALPLYDLSKAELILSFNADFLNDWNGGGMEKGYAAAKKPGANMVKHIQVEGNMSMTGGSADERMPKKPSEVYKLLAEVYSALNGGSASKEAQSLAQQLQSKGSKAVVLVDGDKNAYTLMYALNQMLGSEAVVKDRFLLSKQGDDNSFQALINDMLDGKVGMLFNFNTNPIYSSYYGANFAGGLKKVKHHVAMLTKANQSAVKVNAVAPVPNWLETWNDVNPVSGVYSLIQPAIVPIFNTRQFEDSLIQWMGGMNATSIRSEEEKPAVLTKADIEKNKPNYYEYLKHNWDTSISPKLGYSFKRALYNGYNESAEVESVSANTANASNAASQLKNAKGSEWELQLYTKHNMGDGVQANNPWLQELPDAITRSSWDNFVMMNPADVEKLDLKNEFNGRLQLNGSVVKLTANGKTINAPVISQPGQAIGCLGIALGYGQSNAGPVAETGVNAYPLFKGNSPTAVGVSVEDAGGKLHEFALMQAQNTVVGRYELAREVSLDKYLNEEAHEWNEPLEMHTQVGEMPIGKIDLWRQFDSSDGPHFNLSVDLNLCTACGSCVVACQAENNTPVVGKDEMRRSRDMYWLRIDRYYASQVPPGADANNDGELSQEEAIHDDYTETGQYKYLEKPLTENPDVIYQPVMCQHCNHAPCETVCPVAATSHGKQGQNQMAYNRCVGTRYCANNCPYKVRRFNWFNYALNEDQFPYNMANDVGRMVLNPDVAVRTRGVMEKCSMCIQMTQATILKAKKEGRRVADGEFQTACTKVCGTGALQFGDVNDKNAHINELMEDKRKYVLLEEVGTQPNVFYQFKVRNREENNA